MLSRSMLAIGAAALAALAAVMAQIDGDLDIVPFFVGLTILGATGAFAVRAPYTDNRRVFGAMVATVWIAAAFIIGSLLLWHRALCGCSMPEPVTEATYLGLTATVYHLAGVYLGGALMTVAAFSRTRARGREVCSPYGTLAGRFGRQDTPLSVDSLPIGSDCPLTLS